jgi:LuxR family maltose regulon positive regulatory protein
MPQGDERSALPLLETKIVPPRLIGHLVDRPRLRRRLDDAGGSAMVLVAAPTGYGKTTAVLSWCTERAGSFAWVTLDSGDNDPARLWTYVATAIDRVWPRAARRALYLLSISQGNVRPALDALLSGLARLPGPVDVVLDDVHELTDLQVLETVEYLVTRLPINVRVVALSRVDPAIRLAGLRAHGALVEIRARDLAFTLEEAREMLVAREGIPLGDGGVDTLVRRTEGWPGGLYLAALWLRDLADPHAGVREFAGSDRHVAAYLSAEVLDHLDSEVRGFLMRSAALGRFTVALCDEVLEREDSARLLARLERSNLFLISLDRRGEWFRYHSLFEELLLLELRSLDPHAESQIHRRASVWCRREGLIADAAQHAFAARDHEIVAQLLIDNHLFLFDHGLMLSVLRWIRLLPEDMFATRPLLPCLAAVAAAVACEPAVERRKYVALAATCRAAQPSAWDSACEVMIGLVHAGLVDRSVAQAVEWGERIAAIADRGVDSLVAPAQAVLAVARFYQGEPAAVADSARRSLDHHTAADRVPPRLMALSMLSLAEAGQGHRFRALQLATEAGALARETGLVETWPGALVAGALAVAHELQGSLPEAERHAVHSLRLHSDVSVAGEAWALMVLARIRQARGRLPEATESWQRAREVVESMEDPGELPQLIAEVGQKIEDRRLKVALEAPSELPSEAESAVLQLLSTDLTLRQIASELYVSMNTVKTHTRSLYRKLGVSSRQDAVATALALGILGTGDSPG